MATTTTNPVTTPALTTYSKNQVAGLQPIISDLLTENQSGSKFRANTYTGDAAKIQERLNQYNAYNPQDFGGLADYFRSKASTVVPSTSANSYLKSPAASGSFYMKPADFQAAQAGLSALNKTDLQGLSGLLGDVQSIGGLGDYQYYDKTALENQLNKFSSLSDTDYQKYAALPEFAALNPAGTAGGSRFYDTNALKGALNLYSQLDPTKLGDDTLSKELKSKLITSGDQNFIKQSVADYYKNLATSLEGTRIGYYGMNDIVDPYSSISFGGTLSPKLLDLPSLDYTANPNDPLYNKNMEYLRKRAYDDTVRYNNEALARASSLPAYTVSVDGQERVYVPYEAAARMGYDAETEKLHANPLMGNEGLFSQGRVVSLPTDVAAKVKEALAQQSKDNRWGSDYVYDRPDTGYLLDSMDAFNKLVQTKDGRYKDTAIYEPNSWSSGHGQVSENADMHNAWLTRNKDVDFSGVPYIGSTLEKPENTWIAQGLNDPKAFLTYGKSPTTTQNDLNIYGWDQWVEESGGLGGFLGSDLGKLFEIAANVYTGGMYGAGKALGSVMQGGSLKDAIVPIASAVIGNYYPNANTTLGNTVSGGALTGTQAAMLGSGLMNTAGGLIQGQKLGDALKSGALGALGTGLGQYTTSQLGGANPSAYQQLARLGLSSGMGALGSAVMGRDIGQGALGGLTSGAAGLVGNAVNKQFGGLFGGISNAAVKQMLANKLFKS